MDIAAPTGTPVHAAACGTVSLAGQQSGYGNMVCVTHTSQFSTCYAHLSRFGVSNGAQVQQGQVIGYVGCTGSCTGPHLHFETRVNGQAQNPSTYLSGGSTIPGKRANVAGASSAGTQSSATATTATTQPASAESVQAAPTAEGEAQAVAPTEVGTTEATTTETAAEPVPAEAAPTGTVEAEVAAPAEVAAEPVAVEAQVAAPAEVAPEPVAVEAQVAAPGRGRARARRRGGAGRRAGRGRARARRRRAAGRRARPRSRPSPSPRSRRGRGSGRRGRHCRRAVGRACAKVAAGPVGRRSQGGTVEAPLAQSGVFAFRPPWRRATRRSGSGRRCRSS